MHADVEIRVTALCLGPGEWLPECPEWLGLAHRTFLLGAFKILGFLHESKYVPRHNPRAMAA